MAKHIITIDLTTDEEAVMAEVATNASKTVDVILQQFWDGYTVTADAKDVIVKGHIRSQLDNWIGDRLKAEVNAMDTAEALTKLRA